MASSYLQRGGALSDGKWAIALIGCLIFFMLGIHVKEIFEGQIPGNDDMFRIQQVRDLLNGQGWFDVDQARLLTPEGGEMHWSRLPDIFLASVIWLTRPFLGQAHAEMLAMCLWPLCLLVAAMVLIVKAMSRLGVSRAGQAVGLLFFGLSAAVYNFWPGRIDHHNLVVVFTLLGFVALLSPNQTKRSALILGFAIPAIVTVAIEGLPYAAILIASLGLFWIVRGHIEGERLTVFGAGLIAASLLFYTLDAPGWSARRMVCDAYGTAHFSGFLLGGALLSLLGMFGGVLDTWQKRLAAGALAGAATLALIIAVNPACLGDPYAAVPDNVRLAWLSVVGEAKTLSTLLMDEPERVIWVFGYLAASGAAFAVMLWTSDKQDRLARIALGLLLAISVLATVYQIRGQSFSHVFASIAAGWLVGYCFDRWWKTRGNGPMLVFAAVALGMAPLTWQTVSQRFAKPLAYAEEGESHTLTCLEPEAYAALNAYPEMKIFTSIDVSTSVIARTGHSVFGGPYHRNIEGIGNIATVLINDADAAHDKLLSLGATHLLYCNGLNETNRYGLLWPEGFAAQMNRDEIPGWLEPVNELDETKGVVRLYRVKP